MKRTPAALLAGLTAATLLAGCSAGTSPSAGALPGLPGVPGLPGAPAGPKIDVQEGPAPSVTGGNAFFRADQVTRSNNNLTISTTIAAARREVDIERYRVQATTNTGLKLAVDEGLQQRQIDGGSVAKVDFTVPLPANETVREVNLDIDAGRFGLTIPIPQEDGTWGWKDAPLRQVAIPNPQHRSGAIDVVLESIKSQGMITEVGFRASSPERNLELCEIWAEYCLIRESNGRVHPLLGATPETSQGSRLQGTLRFLGEIDPSTTELSLHISRSSSEGQSAPFNVTLPSHADSPVQVAAVDLGRPAQDTDLELVQPELNTKIRIKRVEVLNDRVQLQISAEGGREDFNLAHSAWTKSYLAEPTGYQHMLAGVQNSPLVVPKGGTLEATLVFPGSVGREVTSLSLMLGGDYKYKPVEATIPLPAPAEMPQIATFGQVGEQPATGPQTLRATPVPSTAQPSAVAISGVDITRLPLTSSIAYGGVGSSLSGISLGGKVASSANVDAQADAEAQKSLRDLGAQRTSEGYVLTLPETVLFDYNKADIKPDADPTLVKVADLLKYYDKVQIGVQGHTDNKGDANYNQDLSMKRAQAVSNALAGKGIAASRMKVEGFGLTRPIASNDNDEGRAKNRRTEIVLREVG